MPPDPNDNQALPQADGDPGHETYPGVPRSAEDAKRAETLGQLLTEAPEITAHDVLRAQIRDGRSDLERRRLHERIEVDFTYHAPRPDQIPLYHEVRERFRLLAHYLVDSVPPGRELSLALTDLERACQAANAGIARHG